MNRTTVVFLALAILLAHTLAIHQTPAGDFAPPYERAHVAFRLGRHWVHEGQALWDPQTAHASAYPSLAWVGVAAAAEWLGWYPAQFAQGLGIVCALITVVVLAQFSAQRLAGLIAPVLFAASGAIAAAAASGTEAPLALLLLTTAFLAFEAGWPRILAAVATLLVLTRPEGLAFLVGLGVFQWLYPPRDREGLPRPAIGRALVAAAVVLAGVAIARGLLFGTWISPWTEALFHVDRDRWNLGLHYLWGFCVASATAPLLILPLLLTIFRRLIGTGRRALSLFVLWAVMVALTGGDELPFWNALAPALPLALLAIQAAITGWLDENPRHAPAAWAVLIATVPTTLLSSTLPSDLGPIPLRPVLETWMAPDATIAEAFPRPMGRAGLVAELRDVESLRSIAVFLRDRVGPEASIATFWPGAIGYLSRKQVFDLLGRTQPVPGGTRTQSWSGRPRVDLVRAFEREVDYVVPGIGSRTGDLPDSLPELMEQWLRRYDVVGSSPARLEELLGALQDFEVVSVPVPVSSLEPDTPSATPALLLRRKSLGLTPRLSLRLAGDRFDVEVFSEGHRQIVDLAIHLTDDAGKRWSLRPNGQWTAAGGVDARTSLLLYDTGPRPIRLLTARLPAGFAAGSLSAQLHSPGVPMTSPFAAAGNPATARVFR